MQALLAQLVVLVGMLAVSLQPALAACSTSITVGNIALQYVGCKSLSSGFNLAWNLTSDGTVVGSFSASASGYIALGISPSGDMVGASAIIGYLSSGGSAGAAQYYLGGTRSSQWLPGGNLAVSNLEAAYSGGVYTVSFSLALGSSAAASTQYLILATGSSGPDSQGLLPQYDWDARTSLNFKSAPPPTTSLLAFTSSPSNTSTTSNTSSPSTTNTSSPSTSSPFTTFTNTTTPSPNTNNSITSSPSATKHSNVSTVGSTSASNACSGLTYAGSALSLTFCLSLSGAITLGWNLSPSLGTATVALSSITSGYISWGLSPTGNMVGASVVIAFPTNNETTGAYASTWYLGGYKKAQCTDIGQLNVSNLAAQYSNGVLTTVFTLSGLNSSDLDSSKIVWAVGSGASSSSRLVPKHSGAWAGSMSFQSDSSISTKSTGNQAMKRNLHSVFEAITWGFLVPVGIFAARYFKSYDPAWFYAHVGCQVTGFILGGTGFLLGVWLWVDAPVAYNTHAALGVVTMICMCLQVMAVCARPLKSHPYRWLWNGYHWWTGRAALILGVVACYYGFDILQPSKVYKILFWIVLLVIVAIAAVLEVLSWCSSWRGPKSQFPTGTYSGAAPAGAAAAGDATPTNKTEV